MRPQISGKLLVAARKLVGLVQPALGGELQPVGDVVVERAMDLAERHAALRAARGLLRRLVAGVLGVDLLEVAATLGGRPLLGQGLRRSDNFSILSAMRPSLHTKFYYTEGSFRT
jgi:hypothetical protein